MDIYKEASCTLRPSQIDHYRSDLYLLMCRESRDIVNRFRSQGGIAEEVMDELTELYWYYIPFGYTPYWQRNYRAIIETLSWEFVAKNEHVGTLYDWSDNNMRRTYSDHKVPPHQNSYPAIRKTLQSILGHYKADQEELTA